MKNDPPDANPGSRLVRIDAAGVVDGVGMAARPGSVLLHMTPGKRPRLLAAGPTQAVLSHEAARLATTQVIARPEMVLIPGLVNAHTHLDLTHIGPRDHDPAKGFVPWVDMIRAERHVEDEAIAASVRTGIDLSRAGGVVAIGDIGGAPQGRPSLTPWRTLRDSGVLGTSYLEFFGIGSSREPRTEMLRKLVPDVLAEAQAADVAGLARLGLQPHAPNTVDRRLYLASVELADLLPGSLLMTHLAESIEEREFVGRGTGPQRELLERFGLWTDDILTEIGKGAEPVAHLKTVLAAAAGRMTCVHLNDASDEAIAVLAASGASVVYCPRASAYFHAEKRFGPHRYRDMLRAGIPVALGTDSIVNTPLAQASRLSVIDEMRLLHARDQIDSRELLRMATVHGARAIGLDPSLFTFTASATIAGVVGVSVDASIDDLARAVVASTGEVELLCK